MTELPHATVATIVEQDGRYLLVKEKRDNRIVFNQPAGHIECGESILQAAVRETLEETRWLVEPTGFAGLSVYHAPNGISYVRTTIIARPLQEDPLARLDDDIIAPVWLTHGEILALKDQLRSPVVLKVIEDHRRGVAYPLDLISEQR
ncbi:MAG: NUDIX hydrolase [Gammaproteobacteria bacterium]|uniref:NUDIX hydrolase n=1 Tax=Pseudomaricurvus alcaniphilus TaxID=1166482 RepID=UPI0014084D99|nr:NUDIX hydrolase [Pseudomaricurvus alcaniphilus]MBR9912342.1 NUDIX hydrolase [Gammaproteobacteria bacterium]NHN35837.1 NUDIX hydrolase [Pseudomaricurvus alcaniphilus]